MANVNLAALQQLGGSVGGGQGTAGIRIPNTMGMQGSTYGTVSTGGGPANPIAPPATMTEYSTNPVRPNDPSRGAVPFSPGTMPNQNPGWQMTPGQAVNQWQGGGRMNGGDSLGNPTGFNSGQFQPMNIRANPYMMQSNMYGGMAFNPQMYGGGQGFGMAQQFQNPMQSFQQLQQWRNPYVNNMTYSGGYGMNQMYPQPYYQRPQMPQVPGPMGMPQFGQWNPYVPFAGGPQSQQGIPQNTRPGQPWMNPINPAG